MTTIYSNDIISFSFVADTLFVSHLNNEYRFLTELDNQSVRLIPIHNGKPETLTGTPKEISFLLKEYFPITSYIGFKLKSFFTKLIEEPKEQFVPTPISVKRYVTKRGSVDAIRVGFQYFRPKECLYKYNDKRSGLNILDWKEGKGTSKEVYLGSMLYNQTEYDVQMKELEGYDEEELKRLLFMTLKFGQTRDLIVLGQKNQLDLIPNLLPVVKEWFKKENVTIAYQTESVDVKFHSLNIVVRYNWRNITTLENLSNKDCTSYNDYDIITN